MKLFFILISVYIFGSSALSISSRVGNGEIAKNAPHVCMVLVLRQDLAEGIAALGSGSIVSRRHVLTAAHVLRGGILYRINFTAGTARRSFESNFALTHENYDPANNANDIALIFLQGNTFPVNNIIPISTQVLQAGEACTVTGHGFTSIDNIGFASINAHSAAQQVAIHCQFDNLEVSQSHFCAIDERSTPRGIVCRGDNGAGLYITTEVNGTTVNSLVGVASHVLAGCSTAELTAYTRLSMFAVWINAIITG